MTACRCGMISGWQGSLGRMTWQTGYNSKLQVEHTEVVSTGELIGADRLISRNTQKCIVLC